MYPQKTNRSLVLSACLLIPLGACAEPKPEASAEIERGLVIDEVGGVVSGSFADERHALAFSGEVAGAGFELDIEVNGMTITAQQGSDGIIRYDGYASEGGAATQMTGDDRAALGSLADALDELGSEVGPATARVRTFADTWSEFPSALELRGVVDAGFRGATSLCDDLYSFVETTHDDDDYYEWEDETTFYAYLSMDEAGPCADDGTWFWTGGSWKCYEPDHSADVEYAFGNCFGRCGNRCGASSQFTTDCANHDNCQRFGHTIDSDECEDEFLAALDDAFGAPNCL
ncbi:hypothetical protein ENSA5_25530 [Enhygromyxa salina]|uniref:Lipoprotein n=1 Tax=Enhygromyxa salina TaxID=215803 RepID=A0A2S9YAS6_9BACT|nr:hypothetical protein [Enhygromyxa salina]PRQ02218.1 hypothetical protein ENSA5_25530 [Enhygromyxa salina]